jgi:2',3'-cyclic-nucleotide 2'-phosphodiesterase (5'-nucleotidase family)
MTRRLLLGLLLCLTPLAAQTKPLTILHSNDLHAHLLPGDQDKGGMARLATAVRREKANCSACLYLNAGDLVQGSPVSTLFQGAPVYEIANLLGFDAGTLGNHEFDYGVKQAQKFATIAHYPLLSANVVDANGEPLTGKTYVIQTVGGVRVAIIGVVLTNLVDQGFVPASIMGSWRVLPVIETVRKLARQLRDRSDVIVVLGHILDSASARTIQRPDLAEVEAILAEVPEVSVVVAGHTHEGYAQMKDVDGRVAVLVDYFGEQLGRLDLQVDIPGKKLRSAEWKKIAIDASLPEAPDVARAVAQWEGKVSKRVDVPIGESKQRLARTEPALQALIERAMAEQTGADLAFISQRDVRDALPQGRILARHIWNMLPYDNRIVTGKFKGSELPPAVTHGRAIDPDREYTLAVTDYAATNQAVPTQLNASGLQFSSTGPAQRDAVIDWIRKRKVVP